jgi:hypothetical protein
MKVLNKLNLYRICQIKTKKNCINIDEYKLFNRYVVLIAEWLDDTDYIY